MNGGERSGWLWECASGGGHLPSRIIVAFKEGEADPLGHSIEKAVKGFLGLNVLSVRTRRIYTINTDLGRQELDTLKKELFVDPVTEHAAGEMDSDFDWVVEVGYKAGVTDPVGKTASKAIGDVLGEKYDNVVVGTSTEYLISGIGREGAERIAKELLANQTVERISIASREEVGKRGMPEFDYSIHGTDDPVVGECDLNVSDERLMEISKRGVLSLSLDEMKTIQRYAQDPEFSEGRKKAGMEERFWNKVTDAELEAIAQTQSEHCKHKIFNARIRYYDGKGGEETIDGLFGTYIRTPSMELSRRYGWVLSAFHDNAGIVDMGNGIVIADKIETHNSPSALEPYGGAITGILGVNRDILGAGIGAAPLFNVFGYCFGNPEQGKVEGGALHPARIRNGIHKGVIDGGNQSGIPLADGFEFFDDRFGYRPLVYCGTAGIMPKESCGRPVERKKAEPGDLIVMVGGRVGKDGIHGATFSSAGLDRESPIQAVQIGDSITQKRVSDFIIEARELGLYRSITDNGAGGLSSSVGEMAKDTDGFIMDLKKVPLKYAGLTPREILISESQERMTIAVAPENEMRFLELAKRRDVEATVLGQFESTGKFHVVYGDKTVAYLDMDFIHEGFPKIELVARWKDGETVEPDFAVPEDMGSVLASMLSRLNVCSKEYKLRQYDHEVKGRSVVKPLVGVETDVPSDATVLLLRHGSKEGIIAAHGVNPHYSDMDTYHMTASVIDEAIRRIIATGGRLPDKDNIMYGLDNFCWNISSLDSEDGQFKLAQLVRANKALADYCRAFGVPCISGKDSMKNVWRMEEVVDGKKKERIISIPPTLLFSARARIDDVSRAVTMDAKRPGELVYVVGRTYDEIGGSEYMSYIREGDNGAGRTGGKVPKVDAAEAIRTYEALGRVTARGLASSVHTPTIGGLGVAAAMVAFAGGVGMRIELKSVPYDGKMRDDYVMFSQSNSRFIITVPKEKRAEFEREMEGTVFAVIGDTTDEGRFVVNGLSGDTIADLGVGEMKSIWKGRLWGV